VVFSVVHPTVLPFIEAWAASVACQSDTDFDLCLALDAVSPEQIALALPPGHPTRLVRAAPKATPASLRTEAWDSIVSEYDIVVMVDADDLLERSRVAAAKQALAACDAAACAVRLVDGSGHDLQRLFCSLPVGSSEDAGAILPRANVFGLSNSAYRAATLQACLPVPAGCLAVDWYLATKAWALGARLRLDPVPRMAYRQYAGNIAKVIPPFDADAVRRATDVVLAHYAAVLTCISQLAADRRAEIAAAQKNAQRFADIVCGSQTGLDGYVRDLNELPPPHAWWTIVAHPDLEAQWTQ
jgi:hypothetical protein